MRRILNRDERQTCPRRMGEMGPWDRAENLDRWTTGHGLVGQDAVGRSCSFCGSLEPGRFLELVRQGWVVVPTDKNYKAYLGKPVTEEERAASRARWVEQMSPLGTEDREALAAHWDQAHTHVMSGQDAKFYYQHLSEAQGREFVQLYNDRVMTMGYPGHFYRLPYFMTAGPTT